MAQPRYSIALRHINTLFNVGTVGGLTDGQLLERFTFCEQEAAELAFAALVERHGPMVLRVCQSYLRERHDAEDAFQAQLLFPWSARPPRSANVARSDLTWVAFRIASLSEVATARRRGHERKSLRWRCTR